MNIARPGLILGYYTRIQTEWQSVAFEVVGFLDDALPVGETVLMASVLESLAGLDRYRGACDQVVVAVGNNVVR